MDKPLVMPAIPGQTFIEALKAAQDVGAAAFHDPETHTLIGIMPGTGIPGFWGMVVRAQRLAAQRKRKNWWGRLKEWLE